MIKRYNVYYSKGRAIEEESPTGKYVKYEDVKGPVMKAYFNGKKVGHDEGYNSARSFVTSPVEAFKYANKVVNDKLLPKFRGGS